MALSPIMESVKIHEDTLLHVIECHPMFLARIRGEAEMIESTYQFISGKETNWNKNVELLNWLRTTDDNSQRQQTRLDLILRVFRGVDEGQEHVANLIDGKHGE